MPEGKRIRENATGCEKAVPFPRKYVSPFTKITSLSDEEPNFAAR
jgi:hypothetical protein